MVRYLTDDTEAEALRVSGVFPFASDYGTRFPPAINEPFTSIPDETAMSYFTAVANHVASYAVATLPSLTACLAAANDACANSALLMFAQKAFRRPLDDGERRDVVGTYADAVSSGGSRDDAARKVIAAILVGQPFLYRSELGDATRPSVSPAGIPLTADELASALSFFLTDGPPDDTLLAAAQTGRLTGDTLPTEVDRLLATPAARVWLDKVMEIYFRLNELPGVIVDAALYPEATPQLHADLQTEGRLFLDSTLWTGTLDDLLTSRTTFVNATLAQTIYRVPIPAGATATDFVAMTMPTSQRSSLVALPGFVAVLGGIVFEERGIYVSNLLTGMQFAPHSNEK